MAVGKKKKVDDAPQSKTARASMKKGVKDEGFKASGEMPRIQSLADGEYARVLDPRSGRSYQLRRGSESWDLLMSDLLATADHGPRIQAELTALGW